jgi:release factor glutamine methyltransferase
MVYSPQEDSHLLGKEINKYISNLKNKEIKVLDMGSGSGIQAQTCIRAGIKKENILSVDVDKDAVKFLKKKGINAVYSDLFSKIKEKFDLILFNPPYLPEHKHDKAKDTSGGKKGYETILRFLKQAKSHLNKKGIILLLFSSLSDPNVILEYALKQGYKSNKLSSESLFFEKLYVYEFRRIN